MADVSCFQVVEIGFHFLWRWLYFWAVAPCIVIETGRRFGCAYYLQQGDDATGDSKHHWNVG
jgi:hypothetical protein